MSAKFPELAFIVSPAIGGWPSPRQCPSSCRAMPSKATSFKALPAEVERTIETEQFTYVKTLDDEEYL